MMSKHRMTALRLEAWKPGDTREMMSKLGAERKVVYGPGTRPRILVLDEDDEIDFSRQQPEVVGVFALTEPADSFIAVGSDHGLAIWSHHGVPGPKMTGHTDRILGIWEFKPARLLTLAVDKTLRVWDSNEGTALHRMQVQIERFEDLLIGSDGEVVCVMEKSGARILALDGSVHVTLKRQTDPLTGLRGLPSGKWLTESQKNVRLWSAEGKLLREFETRFSLDDGHLELSDGALLIADSLERLALFDEAGRQVVRLEPDAALVPAVRRFIADKSRVAERMEEQPTYDDFAHYNSPISDSFIASEVLKKMELPEAVLEKNRFIWDFFNRPSLKAIKTVMKDEVGAARALEKTAKQKADAQRDLRAKARTVRLVLLVSAAVALVAALAQSMFAALAAAAVVAAAVQHRRARRASDGAALLDQLQPATQDFIGHVKSYRRRILSQVPVVRSLDVYSGQAVAAAIKAIVEGKLERLAMQECGLVKEDIIFRGQESIRLQDWAMIQGKDATVEAQIDAHNQRSFWWTDDHYAFAVQYIQYIFLTRNKLDVFTTYYDFVADRAIAKEAHAIYYKDITSILKRDVFRTDIEATEIAMISGGAEIRLTVLNEQSVQTLRKRTKRDKKRDEAVVAELEADRQRLQADESLGPAERAEELDLIEAQLAELKNRKESATQAPRFEKKADEAIENIRTQIQVHKQDGPATTVAG